jgi:putative effector of murein hydrolase
MWFLTFLALFINVIFLFVILNNKDFALSVAIRTRWDLIWYMILICIPMVNIIVAIVTLMEFLNYFKVTEKINDFLDKEL